MNFGELVERAIVRVTSLAPRSLRQWCETAEGRKKVRYMLVSAVAVPIGTTAVATFNLIGVTAAWSAVLGSSVGAIPSYALNRYWVWGKTDRNRIMREVVPFWAIALVGIAFSFLIGHEAGQVTHQHAITGVPRLVVLLVANAAGFGLLWVAKYVLFDTVLFVVQRKPAFPAVPDETFAEPRQRSA